MKYTYSKKLIVASAAVIIIGAVSVVGVRYAFAQSQTGPFSGLAGAIAQNFNINQSQVQTVINNYMKTHWQGSTQSMNERLDNALSNEVNQNEITASQEAAIKSELSSLSGKYSWQSMKSMSPVQRKQAKQAEMSSLKTWAQSQHINVSLIPLRWSMGRRFGRMGNNSTASPSANSGSGG